MNTNTKRKSLILAIVVLFVALAGLMLVNINFNTQPVSAAGTFKMEPGSEVFTAQDEGLEGLDANGLRFTTTLRLQVL